MATQRCDGSGIIYSYNHLGQPQSGTCPSCGGVGCSDFKEKVQEAGATAWVKIIPWALLFAVLVCLYLNSTKTLY